MTLMRAALLSVAMLCVAIDAHAHTRSESFSHWYESGTTITATVTIPLREVMLLYEAGAGAIPPAEAFRNELVANTDVSNADRACGATSVNILEAPSGFVRVEMQFDCGDEIPASIRYRALFDAAPAHVHYAKLHRSGRLVSETLITDTSDSWDIGEVADGSSWSFLSFLSLGIRHIGGGIDHIAFLLGLLLVAGSLGRSIIAVTGFTLGHSVSLVAAVLGYVHADGKLVEAFIGFTVALVAAEYFLIGNTSKRSPLPSVAPAMLIPWAVGLLAIAAGSISLRAMFVYAGFGVFAFCYLLASIDLERRDRHRASSLLFVATLCFGLVHGFGFAGFLMETGILGTSLIVPLLGFNLGVEVGQLLLVAVALCAAALLRDRVSQSAAPAIAAGLCGIGVFWFVGRTFG